LAFQFLISLSWCTILTSPQIIKESPWDDINFEGRFIQADFKDFSVISISDNWVSFWKLTSNKQDILSNITVTLYVYCIFVLFLSPAVLHPYMDNEIDLIMSCVHISFFFLNLFFRHLYVNNDSNSLMP
jgi:hypothetical protein